MRMNKLAFTRRFTFTVLSLLITANLWGQAALSGSGTEGDPYQITSVADWNIFANEANAATYWASGVYIKLSDTWDNSSDEVSTMVGTSSNKYSGIFDGNGKTLTFTKLYSGVEDNPIAPFLYVNGATIRNLTVDGEISTMVDGAAGLIGYNTGTTTVQHVKVSADIYAENRQNCGGFAIDGTGVSFTSCVYNGTIQTSGHSGGFCGLGASSTNFTNCIFIPVAGSSFISGGEGANFAYGGIGTVTNSYYTKKIGGSTQGRLASTSMENNKINLKITVLDITVYYVVTVNMTGYADNYVYTGSEITKPTITLPDLTLGTDYTVQYKFNNSAVENILDAGPYTLTIAGVNGNNYYGSVVKNFVVGLAGSGSDDKPYTIANVNDWSTFAKTVENGYTYSEKTVKLTTDVGTADSPITTMIGVWSSTEGNRKPFSGTFNGNNHVLTIRLSNSTSGNYTAPFVCTSGATIKQVTVEGNINTSVGYAAGLIGGNYGAKTQVVNNVTVSVNITNGNNGSAGNYCAGVAVDGTYVEVSSCVYNGKIKAGNNSAGFIAIGNSTNTKVNNCFFAPAAESSISSGHNFVANNTYNRLATSYYTSKVGSSTQGSRAYSSYGDVPSSGFWMKKQLIDNNDYYVSGTGAITGLHSPYYQHSAQSGGIIFTVTFKESDLTAVDVAPSYYTVTYLNGETPVNIIEIGTGDFTLKITGTEGYCKGTLTAAIHIDASIALDGTGTEADPYKISSDTDWNTFAKAVNAGHTFSGEFLKLTKKIELTINNKSNSDEIVGVVDNSASGTAQKWFSGTFDGGWDTIVFNVGKSDTAYTPGHPFSPSAPFRAIDGATIKNLTVEGSIYSKNKYNSGLVGYAFNTNNNIISCTSSIIINCSKNEASESDCSSAGFVAENKKGTINFTNCIFNGQIDSGDLANAQKSAGFVSYNGGTVNFTNCTMAGIIKLKKDIGTYYRKGTAKFSKAYYVNNYGGVDKCIQATNTEPTESIARKYLVNSKTYYVPEAIVTGWETTTYTYIEGESITIDAPTVTYYGRTLKRGKDYQIKLNDVLVEGAITISTAGIHPLKIEGIGDNYGGSYTVNIKYVNFNSWAVVQAALADGSHDRVITLNDDIMPATDTDRYLEVAGNVVLNLNGKTIDRNLTDSVVYGQVIRVREGANLTINGPGTIRGGFHYPGTDPIPPQGTYHDKRDGGGIHNMGNLVLNNVTVEYNKCVKEYWGSDDYTARGGGIYSGPGSSLEINGGKIESNEARGGGGGVYSEGANPFTMTNVNVGYNQSESKGGGVRVKTTGSNVAELTGCSIYLNLATAGQGEGGGVYMEGGELHMTDCEIMGNQSRYRGCGFYSIRGKTIATNCNISYNGSYSVEDTNFGGGICLSDDSKFIMDGGTIESNNSNANGGGIYVYSGTDFQLKGSVTIRDNYKASVATGAYDSNTYLYGAAVIKITGDITGSEINITPSTSGAKTYVTFAEGVEGGAEALACFKIDSNNHNIIIDEDGNIEVYEPYIWNKTDTWNGSIAGNSGGAETVPTSESILTIHRAVKIPSGYKAVADSITTDQFCDIIIEDGGELVVNKARSVADVLAKKEIKAATTKNDATGWYLISSPAANPNIVSATNLITTGSQKYDLYRYNEAADLQWENYRYKDSLGNAHTYFDILQDGRGYLYRNNNDYTLNIGGTLHVSDVSCALSYNATTSPSGAENTLKGFNIIGNPYSHTIYKGVETEDVHPAIPNGTLLEGKYYVLDAETGKWALTDDGTAIPPMTGILVQAKSAGTLTMKNSTEGEVVPESKNSRANGADRKNIWFTVANSNYEDRTCVEFREGHGLNKIEHLNEEAPMLYIRHNNEDFASVDMNPEAKMFNLNFEAKTMGYYTLSVEPQGEYSYLHLIDKVTEKEIDLLEEQEYTFIGSTSDAANRFIVRMSLAEDPEETDNEVFAYQSGDEIVVTGEGELQVFDVMGRFVATYNVSGVQTVTKPITAGVYIVKLNEKTQKIIIK